MRAFTSRIFVEGLPIDMSSEDVSSRFGIAGAVQKVNFVKNTLGQNTGKAIITFDKDNSAQNAIERFHDIAVDSIINRVKPFQEKKSDQPRNEQALLKRRLYLMNLPYDAYKKEIEGLVKEFAYVDEVVIPKDK